MFGDISIWAWMGIAIVFGMGGGAGFLISRQLKDKRMIELEEKLQSARNELAGYRGDVNQHFLKTSLLLGKLTNNYREVYEHLATGAQKLCKDSPNTPKLELPETKILPAMESVENQPDDQSLRQSTEEVEEVVKAVSDDDKQPSVETNNDKISKKISEEGEPSEEQTAKEDDGRPLPDELPDTNEQEDEVHLGADSAPSVDKELHKTHPAIH